MDTIYWISLMVGGFFVLLSIFGGELGSDTDTDVDVDTDANLDADHDTDVGHGVGSGPGLVDLFSTRALFLFLAFFGLTGLLLGWAGTGEPFSGLVAGLTGLVVGLGGNYAIKRVGYAHISSDITADELSGRTAKVLIPFESGERGKITLIAKGNRLQLRARGLDGSGESFQHGDEVVVLRMDGAVAEVIKPE